MLAVSINVPASPLFKKQQVQIHVYIHRVAVKFPKVSREPNVVVYRLLRVFLRLLENPKPKWIKLRVLRASLCARRRLSTCSTASPNRLTIKTNASASCSPCESACSTRYLSLSLGVFNRRFVVVIWGFCGSHWYGNLRIRSGICRFDMIMVACWSCEKNLWVALLELRQTSSSWKKN
jgi:hypothetical protein